MLRAKLPVSLNLLKPNVVFVHSDLCARQRRQKVYYDLIAGPLSSLRKGDKVSFKKHKCWDEDVVTDLRPEPRSYVVRNVHGFVRRNRKHLYETPQFLRVSNRYDHIIDYDDMMQHNTSNATSAVQERDDRPTSSSSLSAMPPRTSA